MKAQEGSWGDTCVCLVSLSQRHWWGAGARVEAPVLALCLPPGSSSQTVHLEVLEKSEVICDEEFLAVEGDKV